MRDMVQARVILGQPQLEIARSFQEAARLCDHNATALHLRGMNMLYEALSRRAR